MTSISQNVFVELRSRWIQFSRPSKCTFIRIQRTAKVKVLSFRPSDSAYYGLYQQIAYTDPKLVSAFLSSTVPQLFQELSDLEVTHIIVPSYKMGRLKKLVLKTFLTIPNMPLWFLKCMIIAFIEFKNENNKNLPTCHASPVKTNVRYQMRKRKMALKGKLTITCLVKKIARVITNSLIREIR